MDIKARNAMNLQVLVKRSKELPAGASCSRAWHCNQRLTDTLGSLFLLMLPVPQHGVVVFRNRDGKQACQSRKWPDDKGVTLKHLVACGLDNDCTVELVECSSLLLPLLEDPSREGKQEKKIKIQVFFDHPLVSYYKELELSLDTKLKWIAQKQGIPDRKPYQWLTDQLTLGDALVKDYDQISFHL